MCVCIEASISSKLYPLGPRARFGRASHNCRYPTHAFNLVKQNNCPQQVTIPPTRSDVIHACDIWEDAAIAYGYNNIARVDPQVATYGKQQPVNQLSDHLRLVISQVFELRQLISLSMLIAETCKFVVVVAVLIQCQTHITLFFCTLCHPGMLFIWPDCLCCYSSYANFQDSTFTDCQQDHVLLTTILLFFFSVFRWVIQRLSPLPCARTTTPSSSCAVKMTARQQQP